jgi:hypothetical protein
MVEDQRALWLSTFLAKNYYMYFLGSMVVMHDDDVHFGVARN